MNTRKNIITILLTFITAFSFISCEKEASISLSDKKLTVSGFGGEQTVSYTVKNATEGLELTGQSEQDWITDISAAAGEIRFNVMRNISGEAREGEILLNYGGGIAIATLYVSQEYSEEAKTSIVVEKENVEFPGEGGSVEMFYTFENMDNEELIFKTDAPWILNLKGENGILSFNVPESCSEQIREAELTITSENVDVPATLLVSQQGTVFVEDIEIEVDGYTYTFAFVKGGTFAMGNSNAEEAEEDEVPVHNVTLSDFYIGRTLITQGLWRAVTDTNPSENKSGEDYPVEHISWLDANNFIYALSQKTGMKFALPTEAQWEYAARGGRRSCNFIYSGGNDLEKVAWYEKNSDMVTHPVGQKDPNELGLYDMTGNLWEYCSDWYGDYSDKDETDPVGAERGQFRSLRGGSCFSYEYRCRIVNRNGAEQDYDTGLNGFRLVILPE